MAPDRGRGHVELSVDDFVALVIVRRIPDVIGLNRTLARTAIARFSKADYRRPQAREERAAAVCERQTGSARVTCAEVSAVSNFSISV